MARSAAPLLRAAATVVVSVPAAGLRSRCGHVGTAVGSGAYAAVDAAQCRVLDACLKSPRHRVPWRTLADAVEAEGKAAAARRALVDAEVLAVAGDAMRAVLVAGDDALDW